MADPVYRPVLAVVRLVFKALGIKFDVTGTEHIPATGGAVMAINHVGYLDFTFAGYAAIPSGRLVRFMAKKDVFDKQPSGFLMRGMKHIPVDREAGGSYQAAIDAVRSGEIVGVFPEATISQSFELKDFKTGAARMAMEAGAPLLPLVLWGSQRIMTKGRPRDLTRGTPLRVIVGEPFTPDPAATAEQVTADLKSRMQVLLEQARSSYAGAPRNAEDTWWIPAALGGTAPTLAQASVADDEIAAARAARRAARQNDGPGTSRSQG